MKRIGFFLLAVWMILSLVACGAGQSKTEDEAPKVSLGTLDGEQITDSTTVRIKAMTGPTGMGLAALMHNDKAGAGNKCDYEVELLSDPSQVGPAVLNGECDIAAVPINLAATLYAGGKGSIQVICANTLGVLHIVENGNTIQSVADLKGKTIIAPNPGSTPEYVLRYVLKENGIDPDKDVTLEFYQSGDEVASQLTLKPDAIGMLPEPKVSAFLSGAASYRKALDMTAEWNKVAGEGNTLIQGVFIARKDFIAEHPQLVAAFLEDYDASQKLVNTDLDKGAEYVVEAGIIPKAPLAKKAIPGCNITFLEGEAMKKGVAKCLAVLFEANPKSVGGSLPADDIYFIR